MYITNCKQMRIICQRTTDTYPNMFKLNLIKLHALNHYPLSETSSKSSFYHLVTSYCDSTTQQEKKHERELHDDSVALRVSDAAGSEMKSCAAVLTANLLKRRQGAAGGCKRCTSIMGKILSSSLVKTSLSLRNSQLIRVVIT